ncbi:YrdB family protein [Microbacterium bovistercoris]|uniref:YrdB family protein n=1 Tax=Microbacterium bovistercoris TaxID=2293570 RepID=UPI0015F29144|nr:YrdB family protein [Microbacterium bovistercoris]
MRFLLELALLAGAAVTVWRLAPGVWAWVLAPTAVVMVTLIWGTFLSPKARLVIPVAARIILEAVLFGAVGVALWTTGLGGAGIALWGAWALDRIAITVLR